MSNLGDIVTDVGSAVGDLFGSEGNAAEAQSFTGAATLATQNAQLTAASTRIQETQTARQIFQTEGTQTADVAGAGFTESGSALDLLKSTMQQGSLAKALVNIQGGISENSYAAQAGAYTGEAAAANEASSAGLVSAIGSIGGALISGSGALANAGNTVAKVGSSVTDAIASGAGTALGDLGLTSTADSVGFALNDAGAGNSAYSLIAASDAASATDQSVSAGANLVDTIDTSGVAIGTSASDVSTAAADAASGIAADGSSVLSDVVPGLGLLSTGYSLVTDPLGFISGQTGVGSIVSNAVGGGILGDVLGGATNVITSVLSFGLSVICTSLYKRGMLTRPVWFGAQRYGRDIAPEHIYEAYLMWGMPIARKIEKDLWFAKLVAPIFVPWAHELAVIAGEKAAKSTRFGRFVFRVTYAFSYVLGKAIMKRREYGIHA